VYGRFNGLQMVSIGTERIQSPEEGPIGRCLHGETDGHEPTTLLTEDIHSIWVV